MTIPEAICIFHAIPRQSAQLYHAMPEKIRCPTQLIRQTRSARWEGLVLYRRVCDGFNSCILTGCVFMACIIIILTNTSTLKDSSLRSVLHSDG